MNDFEFNKNSAVYGRKPLKIYLFCDSGREEKRPALIENERKGVKQPENKGTGENKRTGLKKQRRE